MPARKLLSDIDGILTGKTTHEEICASLELFGREVMPEFQERDPLHQEWKQAVLAGEIELEAIETDPYTFRALQTPSNRA